MQNSKHIGDHPDARFWNRIAERYARKPVADIAAYKTKLAKTQSYLKPSDNVLEIGCGTGTTAIYHAPAVTRIHATDISPKMISIGVEKARKSTIFFVPRPRHAREGFRALPSAHESIQYRAANRPYINVSSESGFRLMRS